MVIGKYLESVIKITGGSHYHLIKLLYLVGIGE